MAAYQWSVGERRSLLSFRLGSLSVRLMPLTMRLLGVMCERRMQNVDQYRVDRFSTEVLPLTINPFWLTRGIKFYSKLISYKSRMLIYTIPILVSQTILNCWVYLSFNNYRRQKWNMRAEFKFWSEFIVFISQCESIWHKLSMTYKNQTGSLALDGN